MKKIFTSLCALAISFCVFSQSNYLGNGNSGFGGAIGNSSLQITEDATRVYFTLTRGNGNFNDGFVIYLDTRSGGFTNTSSFTDNGDQLRNALSGYNGPNRSVVNFASSFGADYAIALSPNDPHYAGLWELQSGMSHSIKESADLTPSNILDNATYRFSVTKVSLGFVVNSPITFKFVRTYLNYNNVERSDEGYGLGFNSGSPLLNTSTFTNFLVYPASVLPVKLISFAGTVSETKATLNWKVANDDEVLKYELQKSVDATKFTTIQSVNALRNRSAESYETTDANLAATNYYRLKTTDLQGVVTYSKIVQLSTATKGKGFSIFPNPVQQTLNIKMAKMDKGQYDVNVYSAAGQLVLSRSIQYDGSGNTLQVTLPANMTNGSYNCILSSTNAKFAATFLKQ